MHKILEEIGSLKKGQEVLSDAVKDLETSQAQVGKTLSSIACQLDDVPNDTHRDHHRLMEEMIEKTKARKEFWRDVKLSIAKKGLWYALMVLTVFVGLLWHSSVLDIVYKIFNLKGK